LIAFSKETADIETRMADKSSPAKTPKVTNAYLYLPFLLLIILCLISTDVSHHDINESSNHNKPKGVFIKDEYCS
jgi:hypothetical protein